MKKVFLLTVAVVLALSLMLGCNRNMDHMGDTPDVTVDYLTGEYARQLTRDGAVVVFGVILGISFDEDGTAVLEIGEHEYVEASNHPDGFFIADKNIESTHLLSPEASATFLSTGTSLSRALSADEFVSEDHENKLYDIYIMGEYIELLIARYIP